MKTLYIQCSMGVAGDMLMGALYELLDRGQQAAFLSKMNSLGIPGVSVAAERAVRYGVTGTHMRVTVGGIEEEPGADGHHHHHGQEHRHDHHDYHHGLTHTHAHGHSHNRLGDIRGIINGLDVPERVKYNASAIYDLIARAESQVHGHQIEQIHFHEVGSLDAVTDVVGNCLLMELLAVDRITVSEIHVGSGTVKCAHGILPVPAPATALILSGLPIYSGEIQSELCTPTGAALVKYFGQEFGRMPAMTMLKTGYGMGTKDFSQAANCVRVVLGESAEREEQAGSIISEHQDGLTDQVYELCCNIDDMTGEEIGFAMERLLNAGALDVWTEAITMKKSRPAVKLCVLARAKDRQHMSETIFKHTTTIGVRQQVWSRYVLGRCEQKQKTPLGQVNVKFVSGWGTTRAKYEYEDLARIARETGMSLREVKAALGEAKLRRQD